MQSTKLTSRLGRFSPSMIIGYNNCPLSFYYQYIAGIQIPTKQIHFKFGTAVHKAIEDGVYGVDDPIKVFNETFTKDELTEDDLKEYDSNLALGREVVKNYEMKHDLLDKLYDLNNGVSEKYVRKVLKHPTDGYELEIPMSGLIDRLTNSGRIIEYKTSKNPWKADDLAYKLQTQLYSLWYLNEFGELPEEIVYIVLLKKYKETKRDQVMQVLTKYPTMDELVEAFETIESILSKINAHQFDRGKGYHMPYCDCYKFEDACLIT